MENSLIYAPVIVQVALTKWLYIALAIAKSRAVKRSEVNEERRALHDDAWPDSVLPINNNSKPVRSSRVVLCSDWAGSFFGV